MPGDASIRAAARHDYELYATQELAHRRENGYPPFCRMVRIIMRGRERVRVQSYAAQLGRALRKLAGELEDHVYILGPAPAPVTQIRGRHRFHMLLKFPAGPGSVRRLLRASTDVLKGPSGVKVLVDVDPVSML
jgi:primosomal protein N' (replication factor Y)